MCQVHAGAYVSLLTPGKTNYSDCHPRKTTTYILHVVAITTHTHNRRKSIGKKKQRKEKKIKEGKEKRRTRNRTKKARKEKKTTRKARKDKTRRGSKARKKKKRKKKKEKKRKKIVILLADHRNWLRMALGYQRLSRSSSMAPGRERNMAKKSGRSYAIL